MNYLPTQIINILNLVVGVVVNVGKKGRLEI